MPKNKFQDAVYTAIMAVIMVYGMIVYNIALATGNITGDTFLAAFHELYIMAPIAFLLEFFAVSRLAAKLAFTVVTPGSDPHIITYAMSVCICCIMCPIMSLIATLMFKEPSLGAFFKTFALNLPCALLWRLLYFGPFVRLIFRKIFPEKENGSNPTH